MEATRVAALRTPLRPDSGRDDGPGHDHGTGACARDEPVLVPERSPGSPATDQPAAATTRLSTRSSNEESAPIKSQDTIQSYVRWKSTCAYGAGST
jgi:hypothetical protein